MKKVFLYLTLFLTIILAFILACNKEKKLLKCPDGYDCQCDTINLGYLLPCPCTNPGDSTPPRPARFDNDSIYRYWFPNPECCPQSMPSPDVDFTTRTVIGKLFTKTDKYDDYKGSVICINYNEKHIILKSVFKKEKKEYGDFGFYPVYYSVPKIPTDYTLEYKMERY